MSFRPSVGPLLSCFSPSCSGRNRPEADRSDRVLGGLAEWDAAEHKGAGIVGELLLAIFSLLPNEMDGFELLRPPLRERERRRHLSGEE